jgi:hypothetical protein
VVRLSKIGKRSAIEETTNNTLKTIGTKRIIKKSEKSLDYSAIYII